MTAEEKREFELKRTEAIERFNKTYGVNAPKSIEYKKHHEEKVKPKESFGLSFLNSFNFGGLDNDKLIILALILLLKSEKSNELIILALLYILL